MLVSDERDELDITTYTLRREQFAVIEATTAAEALRRFEIDRPDLVVVDLQLPQLGAVEVLRQLRARDRIPVLVIAGQDDRQAVVRCLELGADDVMTKPYLARELSLRIGAILRRAGGPTGQGAEAPLELGEFRLDPETNGVTRGSIEIRLTPTEFRIFHVLAKSAQHVVPAQRLFSSVWGKRAGDPNSLRSHICRVRRKLALDGGPHGSIVSVPAVGYVFQLPRPREVSAAGG